MRAQIVLVAEGHEELRWLLEEVLRQAGYEVLAVADSSSALRCVREVGPDVIVIDAQLPGLPTAELLPQLRALAQKPCFVLMLSTDTRNAARTGGLAAGANAYVTKPFRLAELEASVRLGAPLPSP